MDRIEIEHKLKDFFVGTLEMNASILNSDFSLKNDLGITSLDIVEIKLFVEKTFAWSMTREDILNINTLSDLVSEIEIHIR